MTGIWFLGGLVVILFCIIKFLEMRYIEKDLKPLKYFIRDAVFVGVSAMAAAFIYFKWQLPIHDFFNVLVEDRTKPIEMSEAAIFTDQPGF